MKLQIALIVASGVLPGLALAEGGARGTVSGVVLDGQGRPMEGVKLWVKPSITTGVVETRTGPDGRYRSEGLLKIPYNTFAWARIEYRDKNLCMRVAPETLSGYDSFVPVDGAVRNFKLRVSGLIDDRGNIYYGGEIRVFYQNIPRDSTVEVKFEPLGPLVDGSAGKTLIRTPKDMMIEDVPVGAYRLTAQITEPGGRKRAAQLGRRTYETNSEVTMEWESDGSCVGNFGSGLQRAFLYIQ